MLNTLLLAIIVSFSGSVLAAADYRPEFDPSQHKGPETGAPNDVLVLGTHHLSGLPANFSPKSLEPLLERLQAWKPQLIMIEKLSGPQCDYMRRYSTRYADEVKTYCWDTAAANQASGLDVPAANAEVEKLMTNWPATPTPSQRRHLALLFLAAGEQTSALVQWLRLAPSERIEGDGLDKTLLEQLQGLAVKRNEGFLLAAPLAARLGLERVYAMDDHTADFDADDDKAYQEALQRAWNNPAVAKMKAEDQALFPHLDNGEGVLALYRADNQPGEAQLLFEGDFGAALKDSSPQQYGRQYVGYWETRNLRMVANIRDIVAMTPGKRTLVIVGASHKGYFDAYLNMMHDIKLEDTEAVLR
jgi:hypothetical protein